MSKMSKPTANAEQGHGKWVENRMKASFYSACDQHRGLSDRLDFDNRSVKATGSHVICCADASVFWTEVRELYLLDVATWRYVEPSVIDFYKIEEYTITPEMHSTLLGNIPNKLIREFHNKLRTSDHNSIPTTRAWAQKYKKELREAGYSASMTLNPKVSGSGGGFQGRLQCSVTRKKLVAIVGQPTRIFDEKHPFYGDHLPWRLDKRMRFQS